MTRYVSILFVFLYALGAPALASGAPASGGASAAALFSGSGASGSGLRAAVARAVEKDPSLAIAMSAAARTLTDARQQAVGAGLADADQYFAKRGTTEAAAAAGLIETAVPAAPPAILIGYALAGGSAAGEAIPDVGILHRCRHRHWVSPSTYHKRKHCPNR